MNNNHLTVGLQLNNQKLTIKFQIESRNEILWSDSELIIRVSLINTDQLLSEYESERRYSTIWTTLQIVLNTCMMKCLMKLTKDGTHQAICKFPNCRSQDEKAVLITDLYIIFKMTLSRKHMQTETYNISNWLKRLVLPKINESKKEVLICWSLLIL